MSGQFINSVTLITIAAALSFMAATFWYRKNQLVKEKDQLAREHRELVDRVRDMENQMSKVSSAITPISAAFQAILIKELTHFHTPEMDALLRKLGPPITLTVDEEVRLAELLLARSKDLHVLISDQERDAAVMLPMVVKRVRVENETLAKTPNTELQIVAVVTDSTADVTQAPAKIAWQEKPQQPDTPSEDAVSDKKSEEK